MDWHKRSGDVRGWLARIPLSTHPSQYVRSRETAPSQETLSFINQSVGLGLAEHLEYVGTLSRGVNYVCNERSRLLQMENASSEANGELMDGRFLLFSPLLADQTGMPADESNGIFDRDDIPGWNLWIGYVVNRSAFSKWSTAGQEPHGIIDGILCWVPSALVDLADAGVITHPTGALMWLTVAELTEWQEM